MTGTAHITYTGAAPGADTNTYVLFDSTVGFPAKRTHTMGGMKRLALTHEMSNDGTLNFYGSDDRGTNWRQISTEAITAPAATSSIRREFLIETLDDFRIVWVNGGFAQTLWAVWMALSDERGSSS